jgi:hypothetical protein
MISIRINIELTILFIINVAPLTLQSKGVFGVRHTWLHSITYIFQIITSADVFVSLLCLVSVSVLVVHSLQ